MKTAKSHGQVWKSRKPVDTMQNKALSLTFLQQKRENKQQSLSSYLPVLPENCVNYFNFEQFSAFQM